MTTGPIILVADVGTSSLKAGLINNQGVLLWQHRSPMLVDEKDLSSWSSDRWIEALKTTLKDLPREKIDAIVFSGNGPTLVPLDQANKPTSPVLLWIDGRHSVLPGQASFFLPKVRWFQQNHPKAYEKTVSYLSCPEYLSYLLTGEQFTVTPHGEFTQYIWDDQQIKVYGFNNSHFPPFVVPGTFIGRTNFGAAAEYGIDQGIPVYAGGTDFMMSLSGSGTISKGMACDRAGTSEGINYCSDSNVQNPGLRTLPHAVPGLYNIAGILSSTGRMFEWFRRFSGQQHIPYDKMIRHIYEVDDWANLPFFFPSGHSGERYEFNAAVFSNLCPSHGAPEMGRAVLESIGFTIRQVIETLENLDCRVEALRACGGQAKNLLWNQMKANMINRVIEIPRIQDAELLGCAIEGFKGLGVYGNTEEASRDLVHIEYRFEPDSSAVERYEKRFAEYEQVYSQLIRS